MKTIVEQLYPLAEEVVRKFLNAGEDDEEKLLNIIRTYRDITRHVVKKEDRNGSRRYYLFEGIKYPSVESWAGAVYAELGRKDKVARKKKSPRKK